MKQGDLLRHLRLRGCVLKREGGSHSIWFTPATGQQESVPRHTEVANLLARKICRGLSIQGFRGTRCILPSPQC